jgi:integrase
MKKFLIDKIANTTKEHISDDFDMASYVQRLSGNDADTIDKVKVIVNDSIANGLKSVKVPLRVVVSFHEFIDRNAEKFTTIKDISTVTLKHFVRVENADKSDAKKSELYGGVRNLFNFIDDNQTEFTFSIAKDSEGKAIKATNRKVQRKKVPVYLSEKEMKRFHDAMLKIEYRNDLERNRDILIGRIFLFSGIQLSELIALRDEDLVDDSENIDTIWLHVHGKGAAKRKIPMPRKRLIVYLNGYKEARGQSQNDRFFFHSRNPKEEIGESTVRNVIEKLCEAAKIPEKKRTASVLRNTFGIFVYRHMMMEGNPNADRYVQEAMGHSSIQVTRWLVKFENPKMISAADAFAGFMDK